MRNQGEVPAPRQPQRWKRWEDRQSSPVSRWPLSLIEWCWELFDLDEKSSSEWSQTGGRSGTDRAGDSRSHFQSPPSSASPTSYESPPAWINPAQESRGDVRLSRHFYLSGFTGRMPQPVPPGSKTTNCFQNVILNVNINASSVSFSHVFTWIQALKL